VRDRRIRLGVAADANLMRAVNAVVRRLLEQRVGLLPP